MCLVEQGEKSTGWPHSPALSSAAARLRRLLRGPARVRSQAAPVGCGGSGSAPSVAAVSHPSRDVSCSYLKPNAALAERQEPTSCSWRGTHVFKSH